MNTVAESRRWVLEHAARSHGLWQPVNLAIAEVLGRHRSRTWMADRLERLAGPIRKGEPVAVQSLRVAARQLRQERRIAVI